MCTPTIEGAVDAVILTIQSGIPVARVELVDEMSVAAINAFSKTDYPVAYTLFFEFHGRELGRRASRPGPGDHRRVRSGDFRWETPRTAIGLWQARHDALYAIMAGLSRDQGDGHRIFRADLAPPGCIGVDFGRQRRLASRRRSLAMGDGDFHVSYMIAPRRRDGDRRGLVLRTAWSRAGDRRHRAPRAASATARSIISTPSWAIGVSVMRAIKMGLDPDNSNGH